MKTTRLAGNGIAMGVLLCFCGVATADTLRVPGDYTTLEDAFAAAKKGDRIVIRGQWNAPAAALTPDRVKLIGRGATIAGTLQIAGDRVKVKGLEIRGTLRVTGTDVQIKRNRFTGGSAQVRGDRVKLIRNAFRETDARMAIDIEADGATVRKNSLQHTMCAVVVDGDDATIENNRMDDAVEAGVVVFGDDAMIDKNDITGVRLMDAVTVVGSGTTARRNDVRDAVGGIRIHGEDVVVVRNDIDVGFDQFADVGPVAGCPGITVVSDTPGGTIARNDVEVSNGTGIHLEMDGADVRDNEIVNDGFVMHPTIEISGNDNDVRDNVVTQDRDGGDGFPFPDPTSTDSHGIVIAGDRNVVDGNDVGDTAGSGIVVEGDLNAVSRNDVAHTGEHTVAVDGDRNDVVKNDLRNAGSDGIVIDGSANEVVDNDIRDAEGCGILLEDATTVDGCTITGCDMGGVVNEGRGTSITNTRMHGNDVFDLADLGDITDFRGSDAGIVIDDPNALPDHQPHDPFPVDVPPTSDFIGLPAPEAFPPNAGGLPWNDPELPGTGLGNVTF